MEIGRVGLYSMEYSKQEGAYRITLFQMHECIIISKLERI